MYFFLASYPILGAGLKYIDEAFDEHRYNKKIAYLLAPFLGVLWAYTMLIHPASATILLAIVLGVLLKGKIDNYAHLLGLLMIFMIIIVTGVHILILPLIVLTLAALFDEVGNDFIDKKHFLESNHIGKKLFGYFFDQRWLTKVTILGLGLINIIPLYFFLALLFFDGAYIMVRWYSNRTRPTPITTAVTKEASTSRS